MADNAFSSIRPELASSIAKLSPRQRERLKLWTDLQETLNRGEFDAMDAYFAEDFNYSNPNRPDLGTYAQWKVSPVKLYETFPPSHYDTISAVAMDDDELWVLCHHHGNHTGGRYMGVEPGGNAISVHWFSIVKFTDEKILSIYSIADVLGMFMQVGVLDPKMMPADPYK